MNSKFNNNALIFSAFKRFVLDELFEVKEKAYNMGTQNLNGSGLLDESLQEEIEFLRGEISSESLIIKILAGAALMLSTMAILKKILVK